MSIAGTLNILLGCMELKCYADTVRELQEAVTCGDGTNDVPAR